MVSSCICFSAAILVVILTGCSDPPAQQQTAFIPYRIENEHIEYDWYQLTYCDNRFDFRSDIINGDVTLITYGMQDYRYVSTQQILARQYGFYYSNLGCIVSDNDIECANIYNKNVIAFLSLRNGKKWYEEFNQRLDSACNAITYKRRNRHNN